MVPVISALKVTLPSATTLWLSGGWMNEGLNRIVSADLHSFDGEGIGPAAEGIGAGRKGEEREGCGQLDLSAQERRDRPRR